MSKRTRVFLSCTLAVTAAPLAAQRTWIVDETGGGDFHDISPAIQAAAAGDTIRVRRGSYGEFIVGKSLRILGDPGTLVMGTRLGGHGVPLPAITVSGLPAGAAVTLAGMTATARFSVWASPVVIVIDSPGRVHLERIDTAEFGARDAGRVSLHRCALGSARLIRSGVLFTQTQIVPNRTSTLEGIISTEAEVLVSNCQIDGAGPAVRLDSGELTLTGPQCRLVGGNSATPLFPAPAIETRGGRLRVDPGVTLIPGAGWPAVRGPAVHSVEALPSLEVSTDNGQLTTRLHAPGALRGHTLLSLPQNPTLPTPFGAMWVGIPHLVLDSGSMPATGRRERSIALPPNALGLDVVIQGLVARPNGLVFSAPVVLML